MGLFDNLEFEEDRPRGLFGGRFPDPKPYSPADFGTAMPISLPDPTFPRYLDSARHWGAVPTPLGVRARPPAQGFYLSPVPRPANWDSVLANGSSAPTFPEPTIRPPSDGHAGDHDDGSPSEPQSGGAQVLSDVVPDNYWIPGAQYSGVGHHHMPRANYRNYDEMPLPAETRKVFDKATTGQLRLGKINGRSHQYDAFHAQYNKATAELMDGFMREHNIKPEQMTPDHARAVLKAIAESDDPRIRYYREFIRRLQMFYRLRTGGRGSE